MEHKYAKTQLWVDYIGNENFLPCPFNLIPSWKSIRKIYLKIKNGKKKKEVCIVNLKDKSGVGIIVDNSRDYTVMNGV